MSDGSFALSKIAPGRYFILSRVEPRAETPGMPCDFQVGTQ